MPFFGAITRVATSLLSHSSDGLKVTARTKYVVQYAASGTETKNSVRARDANGHFNIISVESRKSTQAPPAQNSPALLDKPSIVSPSRTCMDAGPLSRLSFLNCRPFVVVRPPLKMRARHRHVVRSGYARSWLPLSVLAF